MQIVRLGSSGYAILEDFVDVETFFTEPLDKSEIFVVTSSPEERDSISLQDSMSLSEKDSIPTVNLSLKGCWGNFLSNLRYSEQDFIDLWESLMRIYQFNRTPPSPQSIAKIIADYIPYFGARNLKLELAGIIEWASGADEYNNPKRRKRANAASFLRGCLQRKVRSCGMRPLPESEWKRAERLEMEL
jgi:hypothetical protein